MMAMFITMAVSAYADKAEFEYRLTATDQNGMTVTNPRTLNVGDTLTVEIELTRVDTTATSYDTYGLEFRLMSRGLSYNNDGASFANGTPVKELHYEAGDSVGFAYYDMEQKGQPINNPALAGRWSYTVTDPSAINITVPVALMYIVNDSEKYEPIGNAILYLDSLSGEIVGEDVSGEHRSGTIITLPDAEFEDYVFLGWSDGVQTYAPGSNYVVTGIVTLTAQWEGLVRDRQVIFDPMGGEIDGADPGGMYADGEELTVPSAHRDGYELTGWDLYGQTYAAGDTYTVDNSVVFAAQWAPEAEIVPPPVEGEDNPNVLLMVLAVLTLLALGWWLWLILWKRKWVTYSLKDGAVALDYRYDENDYSVEVILIDGDKEKRLNGSATVEKGTRLRFIPGSGALDIESGKYKGKLIVTTVSGNEEKKCRIKVVDEELKEK